MSGHDVTCAHACEARALGEVTGLWVSALKVLLAAFYTFSQ